MSFRPQPPFGPPQAAAETWRSGIEWLVDATGCDAGLLTSGAALHGIFDQIVVGLHLQPIGAPLFHQFPAPGGITGLWLLSESHLCCHTFPESGYAAFNLYCCRVRPAWPWAALLQKELGATSVEVRSLPRGGLLTRQSGE